MYYNMIIILLFVPYFVKEKFCLFEKERKIVFNLPLQLQINIILQLEQLPTFLKNIYMSNIILQQSTVVKNVYLIIQCHQQPVNKNKLLFKSNIERMSFVGQVCVHIRGICYSDRSSTVQQNDSDRTGHRQQKINIQIGNVQNCKDTIYNTDNYVWGLTCKFEMKK